MSTSTSTSTHDTEPCVRDLPKSLAETFSGQARLRDCIECLHYYHWRADGVLECWTETVWRIVRFVFALAVFAIAMTVLAAALFLPVIAAAYIR